MQKSVAQRLYYVQKNVINYTEIPTNQAFTQIGIFEVKLLSSRIVENLTFLQFCTSYQSHHTLKKKNSIFVEHNLSVSGRPVYIRNHARHLISGVPFSLNDRRRKYLNINISRYLDYENKREYSLPSGGR